MQLSEVYRPRLAIVTQPLDELGEQTAQLLLRYPTVPCNDCQYCMPCPYGLDIPGILLQLILIPLVLSALRKGKLIT